MIATVSRAAVSRCGRYSCTSVVKRGSGYISSISNSSTNPGSNGVAFLHSSSTTFKSTTSDEPIPAVNPPMGGSPNEGEIPEEFMAPKTPQVTSAHAIDVTSDPPKVSMKDSAALTPEGTVMHGRYGDLDIPKGSIPLEYLALLHPAAEGVAALRALNVGSTKGTLLVYGATEPAGTAAAQIASASGHAVVGVCSGDHSNDDMVDAMKEILSEPGTAVPEGYPIVKKNFQDMVDAVANGDDPSLWSNYDADSFVEDFQSNLLSYAAYYPEDKATVDTELYKFKGKEKDRKMFDENISAYMEQFPLGAPDIDATLLKEKFGKETYAAFKDKFHLQRTAVITGDKDDIDEGFNPAVIAKNMLTSGEGTKSNDAASTDDFVPYHFSPLENKLGNGLDIMKGGPVLGAVIAVTRDLQVAAEAVAKGKTLRDKAEALHFLTDAEKNSFASASSVMSVAKKAGMPVIVVGGELPGLDSAVPTKDDVAGALSAMQIDDEGNTKLNYFLQIFRAVNYPVYADYAIHRATEEMAGPRQIIVTK